MHSTSSKTPSATASTVTVTAPKLPANNSTETATFGSGFVLQEPPASAKTYAAQLGMTPPARDYSSASFCAYSAGQYTDF